MLATILCTRFLMARNQLYRRPLHTLIGLVAILSIGSLGLAWTHQRTYEILNELAALGMSTDLVLPITFIGLAVVTLVTSSNQILTGLYLASDLELLLVAPLPFREIFSLKVLESLRGVILFGLPALVVLIAYGQVTEASGMYFLWALLDTLLVLAAVLGLGHILVMLIARVFPPRAVQSLTQVLIGFLVTLVTWLVYVVEQRSSPLSSWLLSEAGLRGEHLLWFPLAWPAQLLLAWQTGNGTAFLLTLSLLTGAVITLYAAAYRLFRWAFYESWAGFREIPIQRGRKWTNWPALRGWPSHPMQANILKDWAFLTREPRRLLAMLVIPIGFGILLRPCLVGSLGQQLGSVAGLWVSYFLALCVVFWGSMTLGGRAVGSEGRNIALLRVAPLPISQLLLAKFWSTYVPVVLISSLVGISSGLLLQRSGMELLIVVVGSAWCAVGCVAAAVGSDALGARFQAEGEQADISLPGVIGIYGLGLLFIAGSLLSLVWVLARLWPERAGLVEVPGLVLGASFLSSRSFNSGLLPGLSLLLAVLGIVGVWKLGCRRLEGWEIGGE